MRKHVWWFVTVLGCLMLSSPVVGQEKKLVVWSHWGEEPVKVNYMQAVAQGFEDHAGIPVEIVFMPKPELAEALIFALDTTEPDLTYIDVGSNFAHPRIMRSLADLSDLVFSGELEPNWELGSVGKSRNTYIPIEGLSNAIYYNKRVFEQAGIVLPADRPVTENEFLDIIRTLRKAGITPIGEGISDSPPKVTLPFINAIFRYAGPEKTAQLLRGTLSFSDPDVIDALNFLKAIVDAQAYDSVKALDLTLLEGIFEVTDGNAAMNFCGTYIYSKFGTTERDQGQIGVMDWFTVEQGQGNDFYEIFWVAGFAANKNSQSLPEAKQFLEYLMSPEAASLWIQHVQAPYPVPAEQVSDDSLYGMLMALRSGQQPAPHMFTFQAFQPKALQKMWQEETKRFIMGERTVEQFVERMNSRME